MLYSKSKCFQPCDGSSSGKSQTLYRVTLCLSLCAFIWCLWNPHVLTYVIIISLHLYKSDNTHLQDILMRNMDEYKKWEALHIWVERVVLGAAADTLLYNLNITNIVLIPRLFLSFCFCFLISWILMGIFNYVLLYSPAYILPPPH